MIFLIALIVPWLYDDVLLDIYPLDTIILPYKDLYSGTCIDDDWSFWPTPWLPTNEYLLAAQHREINSLSKLVIYPAIIQKPTLLYNDDGKEF